MDTAAEKSSRPQRKGWAATHGLLVCREKRKTDKAAARNKKAEDEKREKEEAAATAAAAEAAAAETAAKERKARQVEKKAMQMQGSMLRSLSGSLVCSEASSPLWVCLGSLETCVFLAQAVPSMKLFLNTSCCCRAFPVHPALRL